MSFTESIGTHIIPTVLAVFNNAATQAILSSYEFQRVHKGSIPKPFQCSIKKTQTCWDE